MATLKVEISQEVEVYPEEVAKLFWELNSEDQAVFFNWLGAQSRLVFQLAYVGAQPGLGFKGRDAMRMIGEYSKPPKESTDD
jgi:hypothetical protein